MKQKEKKNTTIIRFSDSNVGYNSMFCNMPIPMLREFISYTKVEIIIDKNEGVIIINSINNQDTYRCLFMSVENK
ncbi:MAG: hypothetical protein P4L60_18040 [Clostridium sp.]|nr:hypothetical protein [Clostridium sp.]